MEFRKFKLNVTLIVFAVILTLGLTGQYYFNQSRVVTPLTDRIQNVEGVQAMTFINQNPIDAIELSLEIESDMTQVIQEVQSIIAEFGNGYTIQLVDSPSTRSVEAFRRMQFVIEEGIASGRFREMDRLTQEIATDFALDLEMFLDRDYVYVKLNDDDAILYQVISRGDAPQIITVSENEGVSA